MTFNVDQLADMCSGAFDDMARGNVEAATIAVARLISCGPMVTDATAAGWIDATAEDCGLQVGDVLELTYTPVDTGREHDEDDAPPLVAWAGRLFAARVARDTVRYDALLREAADAPDHGVEHMITLLGVLIDSRAMPGNRPPAESAHLN